MNRATRRVYGAACGSWSCGKCAPVKRRQVIKRLRLGLGSDASPAPAARARFLTLTSDPRESFAVAAARGARRFEYLRRIVERETGQRLEYLGVAERGTRGRRALHWHYVMRGPWVRQADWSRWAERAGFGKIVDVRAVQSGELAAYAAKSLGGYLTKAADERWPRHFRRLRVSRDWAPSWIVYKPASAGGWVRMGIEPLFDAQGWISALSDRLTPSQGPAPPAPGPVIGPGRPGARLSTQRNPG